MMTLTDAIKTLIESGAEFGVCDAPDKWIIATVQGSNEVVVISPPDGPSARANALAAADALDDLARNCNGWTVWTTTKTKGKRIERE